MTPELYAELCLEISSETPVLRYDPRIQTFSFGSYLGKKIVSMALFKNAVQTYMEQHQITERSAMIKALKCESWCYDDANVSAILTGFYI